jgi:hypothetical protein
MVNSQQNENSFKTDTTSNTQQNGFQFLRGSTILTTHTVRQMKAFEIYENEMESLSLLNWITTLFGALGTGLISFAIGQVVDLVKNQNMNNSPKETISIVCCICVILAVVCYIIAGISFWKGKSQLNKIKSQCKTIEDK